MEKKAAMQRTTPVEKKAVERRRIEEDKGDGRHRCGNGNSAVPCYLSPFLEIPSLSSSSASKQVKSSSIFISAALSAGVLRFEASEVFHRLQICCSLCCRPPPRHLHHLALRCILRSILGRLRCTTLRLLR